MLAAYTNELPLPVCQFYFQQDGAPVNFAGQMKFFLGSGMGAGDQLHGHKAPKTHTLDFNLRGHLMSLL